MIKTYETVTRLIRPATEESRCRYVELPQMAGSVDPCSGDVLTHVGRPRCMHDDDDFVWFCTFAVRQWPESGADIDFVPIVQGINSFVLAGRNISRMDLLQRALAGGFDAIGGALEAMTDSFGGIEDIEVCVRGAAAGCCVVVHVLALR